MYKHNRDNDVDAAEATASEDMHLLCRVWCICEHILNQTAVTMHNEELTRVCRLFDVQTLGSIQTESSLRLDPGTDVSLDVPYAREEEDKVAAAVQLVFVPDGKQLLEAISKEMSTIYNSLSYSMRPRLVPKLDQYIAPTVLSKYVARKPEYTHCVTNSRRFAVGHDHLRKIISLSEVCYACVNEVTNVKHISLARVVHLPGFPGALLACCSLHMLLHN